MQKSKMEDKCCCQLIAAFLSQDYCTPHQKSQLASHGDRSKNMEWVPIHRKMSGVLLGIE